MPLPFSLAFHEREELCPGLGVVPEDAHHGGGDGARVDLLHAAHDHAHVARLHHDGHAVRADGVVHRQSDLLRQPLLNLQSSVKTFQLGFGNDWL